MKPIRNTMSKYVRYGAVLTVLCTALVGCGGGQKTPEPTLEQRIGAEQKIDAEMKEVIRCFQEVVAENANGNPAKSAAKVQEMKGHVRQVINLVVGPVLGPILGNLGVPQHSSAITSLLGEKAETITDTVLNGAISGLNILGAQHGPTVVSFIGQLISNMFHEVIGDNDGLRKAGQIIYSLLGQLGQDKKHGESQSREYEEFPPERDRKSSEASPGLQEVIGQLKGIIHPFVVERLPSEFKTPDEIIESVARRGKSVDDPTVKEEVKKAKQIFLTAVSGVIQGIFSVALPKIENLQLLQRIPAIARKCLNEIHEAVEKAGKAGGDTKAQATKRKIEQLALAFSQEFIRVTKGEKAPAGGGRMDVDTAENLLKKLAADLARTVNESLAELLKEEESNE